MDMNEQTNQTKNPHWNTAILMNALIMPGSGHIYVGKPFRGYAIGTATLLLIMVPILRYTVSVVAFLNAGSITSGAAATTLSAMSQAWSSDKNLILVCLSLIISLWLYGIIDIILMKRRSHPAS